MMLTEKTTWYSKWNSDILYACYSTMLNVWTIIKMHVWCWQLMYWLIKNDDEYAQYVHPRNVCTVKYVAYNVERMSCGSKQRVWTVLIHRDIQIWIAMVKLWTVLKYAISVFECVWCARVILWWAVVMKTSKYVNSLWYTYDNDDDAYLYYLMMVMLHAMMMHPYTLWWTQWWRCMTAPEDDCIDMIIRWCLKDLVDDNDAYLMHTPWRSQPVTKWRRQDKVMEATVNWVELDDLAGLQ